MEHVVLNKQRGVNFGDELIAQYVKQLVYKRYLQDLLVHYQKDEL